MTRPPSSIARTLGVHIHYVAELLDGREPSAGMMGFPWLDRRRAREAVLRGVELLVADPVLRSVYSSVGLPVYDGGDLDESSPLGSCRFVVLSGGWYRSDVDVRLERAGWLRRDTSTAFVRSLHQLGSPFVDLRTFGVPAGSRPIDLAYGPGTDRQLLPVATFSGKGVEIHRDDPQVAGIFWRIAYQGVGPLGWIRPGFPAVAHLAEWNIDGRTVTGALCSSIDRPGGFVILEAEDLVEILGYDRSVDPSLLQDLVPRECLERVLDWAEGLPPASGRASHSSAG